MTLLSHETILRPETPAPDSSRSLRYSGLVDPKDFGNTFTSHVTLLNKVGVATR